MRVNVKFRKTSRRPQQSYILFSTASSKKEAKALANRLLQLKLVACVNIIHPITSIFRWQGKVEEAHEALLVIKTSVRRAASVEKLIRNIHAYSVPEVIGWPIEHVSKPYLQWLLSCVT